MNSTMHKPKIQRTFDMSEPDRMIHITGDKDRIIDVLEVIAAHCSFQGVKQVTVILHHNKPNDIETFVIDPDMDLRLIGEEK